MAEHRMGAFVQIIVAVIGVIGVVTAAAIANWGRTSPAPPSQPQQSQAATALQAGAQPVAAPLPDTTDVESFAASQSRALDASTAALDQVAEKIEASTAAPPTISGQWRDGDGFTYAIAQQGADYAFQQYEGGAVVGVGQGRIDGRTIRHQFVGTGGQGECVGVVEDDDSVLSGTCSSGGQSWPFRVVR